MPVAHMGVRQQGRICRIWGMWLRSKQLPAPLLSFTLQLAFSLNWSTYVGLLNPYTF